jgi:hypothetical protein
VIVPFLSDAWEKSEIKGDRIKKKDGGVALFLRLSA